eukprot:3295325-Pleurochrysis_carterae.AAC.2
MAATGALSRVQLHYHIADAYVNLSAASVDEAAWSFSTLFLCVFFPTIELVHSMCFGFLDSSLVLSWNLPPLFSTSRAALPYAPDVLCSRLTAGRSSSLQCFPASFSLVSDMRALSFAVPV